MTPTLTGTIGIVDPLQYLAYRPVIDVRRHVMIYDEAHEASGLYLLLRGRVALARRILSDKEVIVDVVGEDQLFGFEGLLQFNHRRGRAKALAPCSIMFWASDDVVQQIEKKHELGVALIQYVAGQISYDISRIQALSGYTISERLVHTLLIFSERFGRHDLDGFTELPHLTHKLLADCIGSSREAVTVQLNLLRQRGYLDYSRHGTRIHHATIRDAIKEGRLHE